MNEEFVGYMEKENPKSSEYDINWWIIVLYILNILVSFL